MFESYEPTEYKTVPFLCLKTDAEQGIVEHLITVYGIVDLGRDMSHPGSFSKTLTERAGRIRVLDSHQRRSVLNVLGVPLELKEIGRGELPTEVLEKYPEATGALWAKTQFLMDTPEGKGAFIRIRDKAVSEFSYAYDTLDSDETELEDGTKVRNLRTIRLWEYGPVLFGMNQATTVIDAKGADVPPVIMDKVVDVGPTTITIRVRASGGFQEGSFRVINIGDEGNGIRARIGRLKGETTTTIQAYMFDKKKWTTERARKWVKDHKKVLVVFVPAEKEDDEPGGPDKCACPKCDYETDKERGTPCRSMKCPECGAGLVAKTDKDEDEDEELGALLQTILIGLAQADIMLMSEAGPGKPPTSF